MDITNNSSKHELSEQFERACALHEKKQYDQAEIMYQRLIDVVPDFWLLHYNIGLLFYETGRYTDALSSYQRALKHTSQNIDVLYNLAICQKASGFYREAVRTYQDALRIDEHDIDCLYNLAGCYTALNELENAINCYLSVLEKSPDHHSALINLAYLYHKEDDTQKAIIFYGRLLKQCPNHQSADHMLAALKGEQRKTAPNSYVQEVFDNYSNTYEDSMVKKLHYTVPKMLNSYVKDSSGINNFSSCLDLGCGTGLNGEEFRSKVKILHGIDISPNMIAIAESKKIYDSLYTGDIVEVLGETKRHEYSLLLAADVFTYIGDLKNILSASRTVAAHDCLFYFSVEDLADSDELIKLNKSGRFSHSQRYIEQVIGETGWSMIGSKPVKLRKDKANWIKGVIYGLQNEQA